MQQALSNHSIIVIARWFGLALTAGLLIWQQRLADMWVVWLILVGLTTCLSLVIQPVMRTAVRQPLLLGLDALIGSFVVVWSDPWNSPFIPFVLSCLVLPSVVSGWRGGVMTGLLFSGITASLVLANGGVFVADIPHMWARWLVIGVVPALVGLTLPSVIHKLRESSYRTHVRELTDAVLRSSRDTFRQAPDRWLRGMPMRSTPAAPTSVASRMEELRIALYAPMVIEHDAVQLASELADNFERHAMIATRVVVLGRPVPVTTFPLTLLRRIIIEALLNVEQHAQADSVTVMLRFDQRTVTCVIQDDGVGLPETGIQRAGMHSLQALMYQASEHDGRLEVFNNQSSGVSVRLFMPLQTVDVRFV
jgi:glucose-6-phosphate-specific signal transduction histidine kinase